jgi:hypothetical protein
VGIAVGIILRAEYIAIFLTGLVVFLANGGPWWIFPFVLLVPDVSAIGYLAGPRLGAIGYNIGHNLVLALAVLGLGWWIGTMWIVLAGAVLLAHVGMDRSLGYGLKLPTDFRDTHLGRIGRG